MKYHINPETGNPNQCVAKPGNCRFGSDTNHYDSKVEARQAFEKSMDDAQTPSKTAAQIEDEKRVQYAYETDTALAALSNDLQKADRRAYRAVDDLGRRVRIKLTTPSDVPKIFAAAEEQKDRYGMEGAISSARDYMREAKRLKTEVDEMNKKYEGWNRYFIVPGGHIHSSMNCHTCNKNWNNPTQFGWLPELSGKSDETAVKEQGALLCTACFPEAPTEWTNQKEQEAAEKAASECKGSRTWEYDPKTARKGYVSGNYGMCNHCGQRVTLTAANKLRGHKPS